MLARRARAAAVALVCLVAAGCPNGAGITCPGGQQLCGGACVSVTSDARNCGVCGMPCPTALACIDGKCGCPSGLAVCGQRCVDFAADNGNCGGCGHGCDPGTACAGGRCALSCGPNLAACGAQCVDTQNDAMHCGGCAPANVCPMFTICCGGSCVNALTNEHCGGCAPCPANFACVADGPTCVSIL